MDAVVETGGQVFGFIYAFVQSLSVSIASGDREELVRLFISVFAVYILLKVVSWTLRTIWASIRILFRFALLVGVILTCLHVYAVGLPHALAEVESIAHRYVLDNRNLATAVRACYLHIKLAVRYGYGAAATGLPYLAKFVAKESKNTWEAAQQAYGHAQGEAKDLFK